MSRESASSASLIGLSTFNSQDSMSDMSIEAEPRDGLGAGRSPANPSSICRGTNPLS